MADCISPRYSQSDGMRQSIMSDQRPTKRNLLVCEDEQQLSDSQEQQDAIRYRPPSITQSDLQHLCDLQQFGDSSRDYEAFERAWKLELYGSDEEELPQKDREWPKDPQEHYEYEDSNSHKTERNRKRFAAEQSDYNRSRGRNRYKKTKEKFDEEAWKIAEAKDIMKFKAKTVLQFIDTQAMEGQTVHKIQGIETYFPYQPYSLQIKYMEKVMEAVKTGQNAILQSPTGTGKSLCLLSAVLSWMYSQKICGRHRKVIYLSRTHSQLTQISKELEKTCFRPTMTHVASRDLLCVKPEIENLKGREKVQACSKGVKLALKDKEGHINWSKMPQQEKQETLKAICSVYKQKAESIEIGKQNYSNKIIQMDDFKQSGRQFNFCPYYYPFHMDQYCDLFLMPYNYILDAEILNRFDTMIANSVIIFDEAHNVPEASCEGRSSELFLSNERGAESEIQMLLFSKKESLVEIRGSSLKQINKIQRFLEDLSSTTIDFLQTLPLLQAPKPAEKIYKSEDEHERIKVFDEEGIELALYQIFMGTIMEQSLKTIFKKKSDYFSKCMRNMINKIGAIQSTALELIEQLKEAKQGIFHNIQKVCGFWSKIGKLLSSSLEKQAFADKELNHFRLVVKVQLQTEYRGFDDKMHINGYSLQMRCLVPWLTFKEITAKEPRCIIFTSGTLSPLDSWESELAIQAPIKLVNKHVISEKQVTLNIAKKNLQGHSFDFRFKNLSENSLNIYRELTETLFEISKKVPSGMLVVCPNFKTLRQLKYHVNMRENLKRMSQVKAQIFQQRGGEKYIEQFKERSQKGAILYCVCRGRASEGIDFPDHHCRAVVFVGIPFPNIGDPILIQKKEHFWKLEKMRQKEHSDIPTISWEKWYFNGTMRAINQSLGRLIRHSKDYGMLFLLDERYAEARFQRALPQWTQMSINVWHQLTMERIESIQEFYNENQRVFVSRPIQKKTSIRQPEAREEQQEKTVVKHQKITTNEAISKIASFMPKNGKITSYFPIFAKAKKKH